MKKIACLMMMSAALAGCATNVSKRNPVPEDARRNAFGHEVPAGAPLDAQRIVSSQHPGVHRSMAATPWRVAHFRPNLNLPEMIDADVLNDTLTDEKAATLNRRLARSEAVLVTMPRLTLLPCDEGCVGNSDYDKMAKRFMDAYNDMARSSAVATRGEMKVKVRWFRKKSLLEGVNPLSLGQQAFGIEFPIEGNMLTLSASAFGDKAKLEDCVDSVALKFKAGVIFPLSLGLRNYYTLTLDPHYDPRAMERVNATLASPVRGLQSMLGQTDYSSRVEPITQANNALLPAIDGIKAGEGINVGQGKLFDSF